MRLFGFKFERAVTYHPVSLFTYSKERSAHTVPIILIDSEIVVYKVSPAEVLHKFLVMRNDYKLKVPLLLTSSNDSVPKKKTNKQTNKQKRKQNEI